MLVQKNPSTVEGYGRTFKNLVELSYSHTLLDGSGYWDDKSRVCVKTPSFCEKFQSF